ncbi:hypothetical protein HAZT_HAZT004703 [Hyalella azteca]|nr:hypothetical protein HAZT_HAZT004703 [Hyalella azteca]
MTIETKAPLSSDGTGLAGTVEILPEPVKGLSDKKQYRSLRLSNGLRALLVSDHVRHGPPAAAAVDDTMEDDDEVDDHGDEDVDEEEDSGDEEGSDSGDDEEGDFGSKCKNVPDSNEYKAAASLSVCWGSCVDPPALPGLMHFLEHMVFMGSKKYPTENGFDNFVNRHGGCDNAYTDFEHTNFHFDIQESYLWEGLDRFCQFFVEPLMMKNAMDRERNAVDSEFTIALPIDDNREQQLLSSFAPAGHPTSSFTWGNAASLSALPDDQVHAMLHEAREKYYSAHFMTLVVQSRHSLDDMECHVKEIFSKIPNNGLPLPEKCQLEFPFPPSAINKFIFMEPMKAKHVVAATWFLPSMIGHYKRHPLRLLAHLIGHEGYGSLLSFYKNQDLAYALECECEMGDFEEGSFCSQMRVSIDLTEKGYRSIDQVLLTLFQYVALLQDQPPTEMMFREYQQISRLNFDFETESETITNVESLSAAMIKFSPEDYLSGSTLLFEFDPQFIKETLERLTPDAVNVVVRSKLLDFSGDDVKTERWFGTRYRIEEFSEAQRELFLSAKSTPNPQLHLPLPNVYIPNDFSLLTAPEKPPKFPSRVVSDPTLGSLFYLPNYKFELPIVILRVQFVLEERPCRLADKFLNIMSLFLQCYRYQLMELLYEATLAKYKYSIGYTHEGLVLHLSGFTENIGRVLKVLLDSLHNFAANFSEEHFHTLKDLETRKLYNEASKPNTMRKQLRLHVLLPQCHLSLHALKQIQVINVDDVLSCASDLLKNAQVNMLIQGNITEPSARELYDMIVKSIPKGIAQEPAALMEIPGYRVLKPGTTVVRVKSVNEADGNSSIVNYYQGKAGTLRDQVLSDFLLCAMEEQCFDTLRTQEQLSYSVSSQVNESNGVVGLSISLTPQAEKFSLSHVDTRVEAFIEKFTKKLREMSETAFATIKQTVRQSKKIDDLNLEDEVARNWAEITRKEYLFDRLQKHIAILDSITQEDVVNFFLSLVDSTSPDYRKLSVQVIGSANHKNCKPPPMEKLIEGGFSCMQFEGADDSVSASQNNTFYVSDCQQYIDCLQEMPHHPIVHC